MVRSFVVYNLARLQRIAKQLLMQGLGRLVRFRKHPVVWPTPKGTVVVIDRCLGIGDIFMISPSIRILQECGPVVVVSHHQKLLEADLDWKVTKSWEEHQQTVQEFIKLGYVVFLPFIGFRGLLFLLRWSGVLPPGVFSLDLETWLDTVSNSVKKVQVQHYVDLPLSAARHLAKSAWGIETTLESDPSAQSNVIHDALSTHVKSVHGSDASISEVTSLPMLGGYRPYTRALLPGLPPIADVKVHQRPGAVITGFLRIANRFLGSDGSEICCPTPDLAIGIGTSPRSHSSVTDETGHPFLHGLRGHSTSLSSSNEVLQRLPPRIIETWVPSSPFLVIAPWAVAQTRRWPLPHWKKLIELLTVASPELSFVLVGSAAERQPIGEILKGIKAIPVDLAGKLTLAETAFVISKSKLLICCDSGLMHVGLGLDTTVIALFGSTDPKARLVGDRAIAISNPGLCPRKMAPCYVGYQRDPVCQTQIECLSGLTPEYVASRVLNL
ncbi:hypothetical protein CCP3SC1AL1_960002 [Gammaproteobacteria bacterium]